MEKSNKYDVIDSIYLLNNELSNNETVMYESYVGYYDKINNFIENDVIQESGDDVPKSSIFKKIADTITKIFRMIVSSIQKLINKITGFFKFKKKKSVNSIMLNLLKNSKYNEKDNTTSWKIPKPNPKYLKKNVNEYFEDIDVYDDIDVYQEGVKETPVSRNPGAPIRVKIPAGPGSIITNSIISVPCHNLIVDFNDDVVTFGIGGWGKFAKSTYTPNTNVNHDEGPMPDDIKTLRTKSPALGSGKLCVYLLSDTETFNRFIKVFDLLEKAITVDSKNNIDAFNEKSKEILKDIKTGVNNLDTKIIAIKLKEITIFQQKITECYSKIEKFGDINTNVSSFDRETIKNMNDMSFMLLNIQKSINIVASSIDNIDIIDQRFIESIKSVTLLEKFVKECVENGVPSKYIAYNTWLIADKCIKGNNEKYKPIWGQTRFVFFPPNSRIIYKIAMNGAGVSANKAEINISSLFSKMDRIDLIAPVVRTFGDDMIIAMEKINSDGSRPSYKDLLAYTKHCNDSIKEYEKRTKQHLNIKISDQHKDNVLYDKKYGIFRSIDYGVETRTYKK